MRINEIASAEEQLALWKLVSDNTWAAISQQAEAERRQRAEKTAQVKLKRKAGGKRGGRKSLPPPPHITPPPPPAKPAAQQQKTDVAKQPKQQFDGGMKQQQPNTAKPQQANALPTKQKAQGISQQQPMTTNPQAAHLQLQHTPQQPLTPQQLLLQRQNFGDFGKNIGATEKNYYGNDRNSKNDITTLKK